MQPKVSEGFGLPEGSECQSDWTWFHARHGVPQRFTILCRVPVSYAGHFQGGRMQPCVGDDCPLCAKGLGSQARYVFSVVEWENRKVGLLELGRGHALQIQDWIPTNGELRGISIEVERTSGPKQSRLAVSLVSDIAPLFFQHLEGPDLARAVKSTWQRQARQSLSESGSRKSPPRESASPNRRVA